MKRINDIIESFPVRLFCLKGYIIMPCIYMIFWLIDLWEIHLSIFCFLCMVGLLSKYIYLRYENDDLDDELGLQRIRKPMPFDWKYFWKAMPAWEWFHWVIVVIFFILTAWAMWAGLHSLFKENESNDLFINLFTGCVTFTLFWLVIMITRNKHVWGFALFYIIFDVMSAFTFNFIHFYDNVSETQRNDATMKACQMYLDLEGNTLTAIANDTALQRNKETEFARLSKTANARKEALNTLNDGSNEDSNSREKKKINNDARKRIRNFNVNLSQEEKLRENLAYEIIPFKNDLDSLCNMYRINHSSLSVYDIARAKENVRSLYSKMSGSVHSNNSIAHRDSVDYALYVIKSKQKNRFESYVELYELMSSSISVKNIKIMKDSINDSIPSNNKRLYDGLVEQEKRLDNGIMFQSIGLSALIDIVPLALSIFVAWCKRKDEE